MHVLTFKHAPLEGLGSIAAALQRHKVAQASACETGTPGPPAGLILMGGPMSANDDLPWVPYELAAIREAGPRGSPVLGGCLVLHLIARALGARVYRNPEKEIGWSPLHFTQAAAADPLI